VLISTFRRYAPARCGAFADERRIVVGDEGGRGPEVLSRAHHHGRIPSDAPARCGAGADGRRVVAGDASGRMY
jgi:hypothetical protein